MNAPESISRAIANTMNLTKKLLYLLIMICSPSIQACEETYIKYYGWAALKQDPPMPTNKITKGEARVREKYGQAYYIATYCESGEILFLEKRWNKKQFSKIRYKYKNGEYLGIERIEINSK